MRKRAIFNFLLSLATLSIPLSGRSVHNSVLRFHQFAEDFSLTAHARQAVILDTQAGDRGEARIPYELERGRHKFCLEGRDPYFTGLVLENSAGKTVFAMPSYERCAAVTLPQGTYTLRIPHSATLLPDPARLARVQVDTPGPPLLQPGWPPVPVLGFWAIQLDPALDSQHRPGRLRVQLPFKALPTIPNWHPVNSAAPVIADFGSQQMDEYSLFHIPPVSLGGLQSAPDPYPEAMLPSAVGSGTYVWDFYPLGQSKLPALQLTIDNVEQDLTASFFTLTDLGNYDASFGDGLCFEPNEFVDQGLTQYLQTAPCTSSKFHVAFRFFLDTTQIGALKEGEAALFQQCSYQGKAAVFAGGTADLTALDSPATTIDNSAQSVELGNNTAVVWQTSDSQPEAITADSPCLAAGSDRPQGHNFQVVPLDVLLSDPAAPLNKKCVKCKLQNVILNGTDLSGFDLSGVDFSGATLKNVKLNNATLDGANFTGATLSCTDFSGTDSNHLTDLTQVNFTKAQWAQMLACPGSLFYTRLSSQAHPLDLTNWVLAGVSLEGAALDYATGLAGRDLTQIVLSGASLQHVNLNQAKLFGAQLNGVNFDGANLSGAFLTKPPTGNIAAANLAGAFLRNVNLSKAQLDGANLTNASFYGTTSAVSSGCAVDAATGFTNACATAAGATMNNTQFSSAYLVGVDFTGAQIQGVQFSNAVLAGANFNKATISVDTNVGTNSGFSGAFLQGTNLATAASLTGVSLADAFVDFSPRGNTFYLILSGQHTVFPGYWNTPPGQDVCAEASYSYATAVPTDNPTITCPDGNSYPTGCGAANNDGSNVRWESPVKIDQVASYQFNATFTKAPSPDNPICAFDGKWISSGVSQAAPSAPQKRSGRRAHRHF